MEEADASTNGLIKTPGYVADREGVVNPLWASFLTMDSYDSISNQMLLMEKYEVAFKIQPEHDISPISLVTKNDATDLLTNNLLEKTIGKLIRYKVTELTGLNINELLELPTHRLKAIMNNVVIIRRNETRNEDPAIKKALQLKKTMGGG